MAERSQKEVWRLTPWLMVALLLGNFILMAFDAREADSKQRVIRVWTQAAADFVQSPVTSITSASTRYFESIYYLRTAQTENDTLKLRIQELETDLQTKQTMSAENDRLSALIKLRDESKIKLVPGKIIGRDPSTWFDAATINQGSLAGIKLYMPVVTPDGLAGRVIAVSPITAQFVLITDDKSAAAAVVGQLGVSNAMGVLRGTEDKGLLVMSYVPGSIPVAIGEIVYTTGQDGIYPPGLKIGEVVDVRLGSATVPHTIYIKPSAKIYAMQEVAVLLYQQTERPKFDSAVPNAVKDANMLNANAVAPIRKSVGAGNSNVNANAGNR
jgi:rod shape-determining protein MreC